MTNSIGASKAAEWIASGDAVLIDVREPDEFRAEHIASAASLPLSALGAQLAKLQIPAGRKVIFQCQMGGRSQKACQLAKERGEYIIYNLEGGINGWKAAGLPVVGTANQGKATPSIARQVQMTVGTFILAAVIAGFSGWTPGFALAGFFGFMLAFAGITGWCGLAMMLSRMPWNRSA
ncbi:rhodanese-like domain-containing protein [Rhizobium sp. ARZ01]|uniref:rhodanese-like domain-containing protein n=1 Tax=Rhizobium sp. ARZ01 TaxID=2769313 RepID=UPI0017841051|nr:rhodanese-like domain-containing protein [Rhizobium sp. ARZ01]MBD9373333.1 rhodanese-like domain-containing protein [Rhizobium sp. ARZ01]